MEYKNVIEAIGRSKSIAVFSHTNPDGDTLGSAAALYLALKKKGKDCGLFCDEPVPGKYKAVPRAELFKLSPAKDYGLAIAVDCADAERLGHNAAAFLKHKNTVNIDHHYGNTRFAAVNIIENTSSAAEVVMGIIEALGVEIDKDIAEALFIGLSTDTGSFQHANTTAASFAAAAELVSYGADAAETSYEMFRKSSLACTRLLGTVLSRARSYCGGKVTLVYTLIQDFNDYCLDKSATEMFVNYAVSVEGTVVGAALCQYSENVYKISLRSRGSADVSAVAAHFGGGGHKQAAGCMVSGFFEDVIDKLLRQIEFCISE